MTRTYTSRGWALGVLLLALVAGGCGGDDENDEFVDKTNKVCSQGLKEVKASKTPGALKAATDKLLAGLRAADPPDDKKATYDRFVAEQEEFYVEFDKALKAKDAARIDALDDTKGDEQAKELGLDACIG